MLVSACPRMKERQLANCALCLHLNEPVRSTTGTVGLLTALPTIVNEALDRLAQIGDEFHVLVHACPEHVVDVYRGRVPGVRMAWRLADQPASDGPVTAPVPRNPVATSSSRV